jgi:hypothetical protein
MGADFYVFADTNLLMLQSATASQFSPPHGGERRLNAATV